MNFCRKDCLLYAVTDRSWLRGQTLASQVEEALRGGATMVQLREKELTGAALEKEAREVQAVCAAFHVPFLINDDPELAAWLGADGVHVGQEDMGAQAARRLLGPDKIVGVTAKTVPQALAAEAAGADYIGSGAVFGSATKTNAVPMEHSLLKEICSSVTIPVTAIGGITIHNIARLAGCGMSGFAVVSGIFAAEDVEEASRRLRLEAERLVKQKEAFGRI